MRSATVLWHRSADYYRDRPWRGTWSGGGGGLLMNQAIHTVDLLQWLLGDVTSVSGHAGTRFLGDTIEVEDTAEFVAHHAGGARSRLLRHPGACRQRSRYHRCDHGEGDPEPAR